MGMSDGDDDGDGKSEANGVAGDGGDGVVDSRLVTDGSANSDGVVVTVTVGVGVTVTVSHGDGDGDGDGDMTLSSSISSNTGGDFCCCCCSCCCCRSSTFGDSNNGGNEGSPPILGMTSPSSFSSSTTTTGSHVTPEMKASPTDGVNTIVNTPADADRSTPGNASMTARYGTPPPAAKTSRPRVDRVSFAGTTTSKTRAPVTNAGG